jgi:hypothetical protein
MTTFKIVFTFDVFFSAETTCTARLFVMLKIYFIYKVAGKKSRSAT